MRVTSLAKLSVQDRDLLKPTVSLEKQLFLSKNQSSRRLSIVWNTLQGHDSKAILFV